MKWIKSIYEWVLHWADTPYGIPALFLLSFAEASFFPVPPDVLLIALALGNRGKALRFAFYCAFASVMGSLAGYAIGHWVWWSGPGEFSATAWFFYDHVPGFTTDMFHRIKALYESWNFWVVFTAGFTPIPFKVFTITAGAFDINLPMFVLAGTISRSARFFLVAGLIWKFGEPIRAFIDKYFNLLAILFTILLVGGFAVIKLLM